MRCPSCQYSDTQVKDSRPSDDKLTIRRRRYCPKCDYRFTTVERLLSRLFNVVKKTGERRPFDRNKITQSIALAVRKRQVSSEQVEMIVNDIVQQLENSGESDVPTGLIGTKVMEALSKLDPIAYIRFASVYKDFKETTDFEGFIKGIEDK